MAFAIHAIGWALDDMPPASWDVMSDDAPTALLSVLEESSTCIWAANGAAAQAELSAGLGMSFAPGQIRCFSAQAGMMGLPHDLDAACAALGIDAPPPLPGMDGGSAEDLDGFALAALMDTVSGRAAALRVAVSETADFGQPDWEHELFRLDQCINARGIPIDMPAVRAASAHAATLEARRTAELSALTGLERPTGDRLLGWLRKAGYRQAGMTKAHVLAGLEAARTPRLRQALTLRQDLARSSLAKFAAIERAVSYDNRLRGALKYGGAIRTRRWSGRIWQPQNLASPSPALTSVAPDIAAQLPSLSFEDLEALPGGAADALAACARPVMTASDGHVFADVDLTAIENCTLGWLTGDEGVRSVYRSGRDPYIAFAAILFGDTYDVIEARVAAGDKRQRTLAKPPVLGCLGIDTPVVTDRGIVDLGDVRADDLLFDGVEWIGHGGMVSMGLRETINLNGVDMTPDHLILTDDGPSGPRWSSAWTLMTTTEKEYQGATGLADLSSKVGSTGRAAISASSSAALAAGVRLPFPATWSRDGTANAGRATPTTRCPRSRARSDLTSTAASKLATAQPSGAAATPGTPRIQTMAGAELSSDYPKMNTSAFSSMASDTRRIAGSRSTTSTMTGTTNAAIFGSQMPGNRPGTAAAHAGSSMTACGSRSTNSGENTSPRLRALSPTSVTRMGGARKSSSRASGRMPVYDLVNAGPRARFMIIGSDGPMIVHNCGYGLGPGVLEGPSGEPTGLLAYAAGMGVDMTQDEAKRAVSAFRKAYPDVVRFWARLERAVLHVMASGQAARVGHLRIDRPKDRVLRISLPSGGAILYWDPQVIRTDRGEQLTYMHLEKGEWRRVSTYGAKLTENVVQAVARDILANGMLRAAEAGLDIVLHVHDQIVAEVREEEAEAALETLIRCMSALPAWADKDLPLRAEGHISKRFTKV